jgi:cytochrome c553
LWWLWLLVVAVSVVMAVVVLPLFLLIVGAAIASFGACALCHCRVVTEKMVVVMPTLAIVPVKMSSEILSMTGDKTQTIWGVGGAPLLRLE